MVADPSLIGGGLKHLLLISGTRPEVIKLAPIWFACKKNGLQVDWLATGQHDELQIQAFKSLRIEPTFFLPIIKRSNLGELYSSLFFQLSEFFAAHLDYVGSVVQGDTATAFSGAMISFLFKKKVFYVESGLRSFDLQKPFPEEANRQLLPRIVDINFVPTSFDEQNLLNEGISASKIVKVGNTVVDSLRYIEQKIDADEIMISNELKKLISKIQSCGKKIIIFSMHRREAFNGFADKVLKIFKKFFLRIVDEFFVILIQHPNQSFLFANNFFKDNFTSDNYDIINPLSFHDFVFLLKKSAIILSDSGGIFEESVSMGKPVIALREKSERFFPYLCENAFLLGNDDSVWFEVFHNAFGLAREEKTIYNMTFGDGQAGTKIVNVIKKFLELKDE